MDCPEGKSPLSRKQAEAIASRARFKKRGAIQAYKCPTCGDWHVGNRPYGSRPGRKS